MPSTLASSPAADVGPVSSRSPAAGLKRWFGAYDEGDPVAYRYLLIMRFAVVNLVGFALQIQLGLTSGGKAAHHNVLLGQKLSETGARQVPVGDRVVEFPDYLVEDQSWGKTFSFKYSAH